MHEAVIKSELFLNQLLIRIKLLFWDTNHIINEMLSISIKEYDYLKNEVLEIRRSINRYIGYIISVAGISGVLIKYLYATNSAGDDEVYVNPISILISLVALIVITFLFEMLFYKFKSHNRYCGYMQLLSQEMFSAELDYDVLSNESKTLKKDYLKLELKSQYTPDGLTDLITWEFVMSRYNNVGCETSIKNILKSTDKIKFKFSFPRDIDLDEVADFEKLDEKFFTKIIIDLYSFNKRKKGNLPRLGFGVDAEENDSQVDVDWVSDKKRGLLGQIWVEVRYGFGVLFSFRKVNTRERVAKIIGASVDSKYLSFGWQYPKKLTQIGFLSFICLSFVLFYGFISCYWSAITVGKIEVLPVTVFAVWLMIFLRWIFTFFGNLSHLIAGKYSIEYYCWLFFIFRVQVLNKNNIFPEFYCRGFTRYFKSHLIWSYCKNEVTVSNEEKPMFKKYLDHLENGTRFDDECSERHKEWKEKAYAAYNKKSGSKNS